MFRSARRGRLAAGLLLVSLVGGSLATNSITAAAHDSQVTQDDPTKYGEPHAGWIAPPAPTGPLAPVNGTLFGTHSEDSHSGELTIKDQHILETEAALGFPMHINNSYYGGFDSIARKWDPALAPTRMDKRGLSKLAYWDIENGRIPLVGWGCADSTDITSGQHDSTIRKTAEAMKFFGNQFFLRYCWEMDGDKRFSESGVGYSHQFVAAWIHIHDIFEQVGADNVIWVWCANANSFKNRTDHDEWAWDYYPGDEYVDWVSADGYNWGVSKRNSWGSGSRDRWRGFIEIFDEFMVWARSTGPVPASMISESSDVPEVFPRKKVRKPIMIGEYAAQDAYPGGMDTRKPGWLKDAHDSVNGSKQRSAECPNCGIYSDIGALVYFDINADASHENGDWRILSSPASAAATKASVGDEPWYRNSIFSLGWGPTVNRTDAPTTPPTTTPPTTAPPTTTPTTAPPTTTPPTTTPAVTKTSRAGYWMLGADGKIYPFGDAEGYGDAPIPPGAGAPFTTAAADLEPTPSGNGYWVVDSAGAVFAYGDAGYFGRMETSKLDSDEKVTSLSATPTGKGYWVFTSKGRVATFGDAFSYGDMTKTKLNGPVLDSIPTPSGKGYYMVGSDGGIFAFGDAAFHGSLGNLKLNAPVQSLVPTGAGRGYWLVASDGGIFAFGNAPFHGSLGSTKLNKPITGMVPFGNGYLMVGEDGGIFNFSDRDFLGSLGASKIPAPVVAVAALD